MTLIAMGQRFIYLFGGIEDASQQHLMDGCEVLQRLDTWNMKPDQGAQWERYYIKSPVIQRCQYGVIPLNRGPRDFEQKYLIFGGVGNDNELTQDVLLFKENL